MSNASELIQRIESLVEQFGVEAVQNGLTFVATFRNQTKTIRVRDASGFVYFDLTVAEYNRVAEVFHKNAYTSETGVRIHNKIQAIKTLRDIVTCGLKEAKDVVEYEHWDKV